MKMKKTLSLFLCIIMLAGMVLSLSACKKCDVHIDDDHDGICEACKKEVPAYNLLPKDSFLSYSESATKVLGKATEIGDLEDMSLESNYGSLILFRNYSADDGDPEYVVLNTESGEAVLTVDREEFDYDEEDYHYTYVSLYNNLIVKRVDKYEDDEFVDYTFTLYDMNGNQIATKVSKSSSVSPTYYNSTMFGFNGKLYSYEDGVVTEMFDIGLRNIPTFDYSNDKYYYDMNGSTFSIYDTNFALVYRYEPAHDNVDETNVNVLANGNVLIQQITILAEDATEYNYFDGDKYNFQSFIFDVETKELTEVTLDFVVEGTINELMYSSMMDDQDGVNLNKVANIAQIYKIVDKATAYDSEYVHLSNDGKILAYLDQIVPNQEGIATPIDDDRYMVSDEAGKRYVVKGDGTMVGEVSGATYLSDLCLFYKDGKYYDTDTQLVLDANETDYSLISSDYSYKIYRGKASSDGEYKYYIIKDNAFVQIKDIDKKATNFNFYTNFFYYTYTSGGTSYRVYCNTLGEEIGEFNTSKGSCSHNMYEDCLFIQYYASDSSEYYVAAFK